MKEEVGEKMRKSPLISVVIALYNSGRTLDRCIESIAEQTYGNWELVLIDSDSKDETPQIAKKWIKSLGEDRCRYYNIMKRGHPAKRNFGIQQARGDLLFFNDSDQYLPLTAFEECLRLIEQGNEGIHIRAVSDFEGKSYFSKCNTLSIELFTAGEGIRAPSMVRLDHAELLYQDEDLDWVDDSLTMARFKERDLKIASIHSPMIHDRDIPLRSLVLKTHFIVLANKKQSKEQMIDGRFMQEFPEKMLWLIKSQPTNVPGVLLAFLVRTSVRMTTMI
jgi:glycosyltransferase involved in cell wall biosynthesis